MAILWQDRALRDLEGIFVYIAKDDPSAARNVVQRLRSAILQLTEFPRRGRKGMFPGTLELVVPKLPYVVVYRLLDDDVEVLAVPHAAQHR